MARRTPIRETALKTIIPRLRDAVTGASSASPIQLTIGHDLARELLAVLVEAQAMDELPNATPATMLTSAAPPLSARTTKLLLEVFGSADRTRPES